ncbi:hypothetical protein T09_2860 [Trichinella sp. T9]|nr:hypothetical protein T09_2860 [Trichinella sp. T9]
MPFSLTAAGVQPRLQQRRCANEGRTVNDGHPDLGTISI